MEFAADLVLFWDRVIRLWSEVSDRFVFSLVIRELLIWGRKLHFKDDKELRKIISQWALSGEAVRIHRFAWSFCTE